MAKIKVMLDVPSDCCDCCDYFDYDHEECLIFNEELFYDEEKDCRERCYACKEAQKECPEWNR